MHIWLRDEARATERRSPLTPAGAAVLLGQGAVVTVERSPKRVFADAEYAAAGCVLVDSGAWVDAPPDALVLGVKELPPEPAILRGRYAHFSHLFKAQSGWQGELDRFTTGRATLYDLEYLTGADGRRVAAFGYWAGWLGAAIGLWGFLARRDGVAGPFAGVADAPSRAAFVAEARALAGGAMPIAVVIGALGRSGQGACDLLNSFGIEPTRWDQAETANLDRAALLSHDLLVNCVLLRGPGLQLATRDALEAQGARLSMIADVACDPFSSFNPLPVYDAPTSWDAPFCEVARRGGVPVHLTAIDNLPSLLPREASEDFAAQLLPVLQAFPAGIAWQNAEAAFRAAQLRRKA